MTSLVNKYQEKLRAAEALRREIEALEQNQELQKEKLFIDRLNDLVNEYGFSRKQVLEIMGLKAAPEEGVKVKTERKRTQFIYRNPHSGEQVEASSTRNAIITAWIEQYGRDVVLEWRTAV